MSKLLKYLETESKTTTALSARLPSNLGLLLDKVVEWRVKNGHSTDKSHFIRQCITASLMLDKPLELLPEVQLPDMEAVIKELEEPAQPPETEVINPKNTENGPQSGDNTSN